MPIQQEPLRAIRDKVSLFSYSQPYKGSFKRVPYDSAQPPPRLSNNPSCKASVDFIQRTLLAHVQSGGISQRGGVGEVTPPHIVLPLTVEPMKPWLCHDACNLNLWLCDLPFALDKLRDLPQYVSKDTFQAIIDDKSGYDHLLVPAYSRTVQGDGLSIPTAHNCRFAAAQLALVWSFTTWSSWAIFWVLISRFLSLSWVYRILGTYLIHRSKFFV